MDRPWVAHYDPGVPSSLSYPDITLPQLFERTATAYPKRIATVFHGRAQRYGQLQREIEYTAGGLSRLGVRQGDRVAIVLPNMTQYVVAFFAVLRIGAIVVPTNPLYTQHELEHQLIDAGASVIITLDQLFPRVQAALTATSLRAVILTGVEDALPTRLRLIYLAKQRYDGHGRIPPGGVVYRFHDLLDGPPSNLARQDPDALAVLQYTGGTTGLSKGAMLTHRNLIANSMQGYHWQGTSSDEQVAILCVAPFFHVYGMTVGMNLAVIAGATMLLVPRWNAKGVAAVARKYHPVLFPGVPTMYLSLANLPGVSRRDFSSLRVCLSGAAPLPPEIQRRFEAVSGARVVEGYGLTEASPVTHCNPVHGEARVGTIGLPFPDTEATITGSETWAPLPIGEVGEITVRGPQVMRGYWNRPEETLNVLRDGWLHTGDLGIVDADGYFRIVDRKKDLIIAGGYNVYPREVEDVLYSFPKIREAAVIGVPNQYRGETVKAFVVLKAGETATPEEIIAFCREELAAYKAPKLIEFRTELPKTLIGKILRRELRDAETLPSTEPAVSDQQQIAAG